MREKAENVQRKTLKELQIVSWRYPPLTAAYVSVLGHLHPCESEELLMPSGGLAGEGGVAEA